MEAALQGAARGCSTRRPGRGIPTQGGALSEEYTEWADNSFCSIVFICLAVPEAGFKLAPNIISLANPVSPLSSDFPLSFPPLTFSFRGFLLGPGPVPSPSSSTIDEADLRMLAGTWVPFFGGLPILLAGPEGPGGCPGLLL